ncbi:hypothetical protein JG688_00016291 [Phytophthora aleatoria]|uniref:Uncharacterized protein n=1 Tax=Phytophthora aleatoria TaxID=2496075 RepID=A0A8J5M260_9STRA|nr:hypothetical protein JG688_00016291 [Phytophthora aleatoria]
MQSGHYYAKKAGTRSMVLGCKSTTTTSNLVAECEEEGKGWTFQRRGRATGLCPHGRGAVQPTQNEQRYGAAAIPIKSKAHSAETTNSSCSYGVAQSAT